MENELNELLDVTEVREEGATVSSSMVSGPTGTEQLTVRKIVQSWT